MKIFILFSLLAFAAQAQTTQANFQAGSKIEASQLNSMINFILDNSYKKQETLVTYTGSGLSTVDNQNLDGEIYNNVLDYQNETVQGDTGIISSDNKRYIIVNQDNVTITLTGTIYHSLSNGASYYIHHHTNGVMDKSFVQRFTGIFGGGLEASRFIQSKFKSYFCDNWIENNKLAIRNGESNIIKEGISEFSYFLLMIESFCPFISEYLKDNFLD